MLRGPGEVEIDERDRKDYFSPSTELFADYCSSIVTRYGLSKSANILQSDVHDIQFGIIPGSRDVTTQLFTVSSYKGTFLSRAVVLAIGPGHTKMLPWELSAEEQMGACHSSEIESTTFPSVHVRKKITQGQDTNVVVVGGGLSSAQIVDMAIRKGVTRVWYIMRGDLKVKHFDVSLNWVGKFRNYEKAVFWSADDDEGQPAESPEQKKKC
jgi:lysine/ornithine N-monooxygenase